MTTISLLCEDAVPHIFITVPAMSRVHEIVRQSKKEVGWMGQMIAGECTNDMKSLTLFNPYCPRQEVSGATTDIDAEGVAEYALKVKQPELIKWWGHSHVKMGVNPSGTDIETFEEHVEFDPDNPFVMTIHNKMGESYCNVYLGRGVYAKDVPLHIDWADAKMIKSVEKELKENVREKTYVKSIATNGYRPGTTISHGKGKRGGNRGNGKSHSVGSKQERNAERNFLGFGFY